MCQYKTAGQTEWLCVKERTAQSKKHHDAAVLFGATPKTGHRAPLYGGGLFQLVQVLIQLGNVMDALTPVCQHMVQQGVTDQVDQPHGRGIAVKSGDAV